MRVVAKCGAALSARVYCRASSGGRPLVKNEVASEGAPRRWAPGVGKRLKEGRPKPVVTVEGAVRRACGRQPVLDCSDAREIVLAGCLIRRGRGAKCDALKGDGLKRLSESLLSEAMLGTGG